MLALMGLIGALFSIILLFLLSGFPAVLFLTIACCILLLYGMTNAYAEMKRENDVK